MTTKDYYDLTEPEMNEIADSVSDAIEARIPNECGFLVLFWPANETSGLARCVYNVDESKAKMILANAYRKIKNGDYVPRQPLT